MGTPPSAAHAPSAPKTQLLVGAARWLCSGHRRKRSAWLGNYARALLGQPDALICHPLARGIRPTCPRRACPNALRERAGSDDGRGRSGCDEPTMMPWLRTELRMAVVLRSRPLGPMLTPPAGELWPLCVRLQQKAAVPMSEGRLEGIAHFLRKTNRRRSYCGEPPASCIKTFRRDGSILMADSRSVKAPCDHLKKGGHIESLSIGRLFFFVVLLFLPPPARAFPWARGGLDRPTVHRG